LVGFYTHAGHSYHINGSPSLELQAVYEINAMMKFSSSDSDASVHCCGVSIGATPTASRPASAGKRGA
jgi:D-serine deaminase-like pyridoxal phosphate-dependent protein